MLSRKIRDQLISTICRAVADDNPDLRQLSLLYYRLQSMADIGFLVPRGSNQRICQVAHSNSPFRFRSLDAWRRPPPESGTKKTVRRPVHFIKMPKFDHSSANWATGVPTRL